MNITELWNAHWANPNDTSIRGQIAMRDPGGARQLCPIGARCFVTEHAETVEDLEAELDESMQASIDAVETANDLTAENIRLEALVTKLQAAK